MTHMGSALIDWSSGSVRRIRTETPYSNAWVDEVRGVVPATDRTYLGNQIWVFNFEWYPLIRHLCEEYFIGVTDLVEKDPPTNTVEDWRKRLEEWRGREPDPGPGPDLERVYDPYRVLHLLPTAPLSVVQAAYRAMAKLHHTDVGGTEARMQEINKAYEDITSEGGIG